MPLFHQTSSTLPGPRPTWHRGGRFAPRGRRSLALIILTGLSALPMERHDKLQHVGAGAAIASAVTLLTRDPIKGCAAALGVGVVKELYDATGRGNVELLDALSTSLGCIAAFRL